MFGLIASNAGPLVPLYFNVTAGRRWYTIYFNCVWGGGGHNSAAGCPWHGMASGLLVVGTICNALHEVITTGSLSARAPC
jgi:hypothetical protein